VRLWPRTGRRHQLRLHCAEALRTPILGDRKYGGAAAAEQWEVTAASSRCTPPRLPPLFAHAHRMPVQTVLGTRSPPMHLHLGRLTLADWFAPGRALHVTAPLPPHMLATGRALGLSAKELTQIATEQGQADAPPTPPPAPAPSASARRR
jgi:hypothetical protein